MTDDSAGLDPAGDAQAHYLIHDLLARLSHLADRGGIEEYLSLWTPDGQWEGSEDSARGTAELRSRVERYRAMGIQGPGSNTRHVSTTRFVDVLSNESARAESYFIYFTDVDGQPRATRVGRYVDDLVRLDGGWRLARRRIVLDD